MCIKIFLLVLLLSLLIVYFITSNSSNGTVATSSINPAQMEEYTRCLCSPLGALQCNDISGLSQADRMYAYPPTDQVSANANFYGSSSFSSFPMLGVSQSDKMYSYGADTGSSGSIQNQQPSSYLSQLQNFSSGVSQADEMYMYPSNVSTLSDTQYNRCC